VRGEYGGGGRQRRVKGGEGGEWEERGQTGSIVKDVPFLPQEWGGKRLKALGGENEGGERDRSRRNLFFVQTEVLDQTTSGQGGGGRGVACT